MPNEPLRTSCPACRGTGHVTYLRSGQWINDHCPGRNGPVDVDDAPYVHELDNYYRQRIARIEYKNPGERINPGHEFHFQAFLQSTNSGWTSLLVLVLDDEQHEPDSIVRYKWRSSTKITWDEDGYLEDTIDSLGRRIASWLWGN